MKQDGALEGGDGSPSGRRSPVAALQRGFDPNAHNKLSSPVFVRSDAGRSMFQAVGLQVAVVVVLALVAGGIWGWETGLSLAYGGGAVIVPNALFALRLALHRGRRPESYPVVFFLGEFVKIGLIVALLVWAAMGLPQLRWPPLVAGLIAALQAPLLLPLVVSRKERAQEREQERARRASEAERHRH